MILAISALLSPKGSDGRLFDKTSQILYNFAEHGNLTAAEFVSHIELIRKSMEPHCEKSSRSQTSTGQQNIATDLLPETLENTTSTEFLDVVTTEGFILNVENYTGDFDFLDQLVGFEDQDSYVPVS